MGDGVLAAGIISLFFLGGGLVVGAESVACEEGEAEEGAKEDGDYDVAVAIHEHKHDSIADCKLQHMDPSPHDLFQDHYHLSTIKNCFPVIVYSISIFALVQKLLLRLFFWWKIPPSLSPSPLVEKFMSGTKVFVEFSLKSTKELERYDEETGPETSEEEGKGAVDMETGAEETGINCVPV